MARLSEMNPLQTILAVSFFVWAVISSILILARGGSWFESGRTGYDLIWKYSPPFWRRLTLWLAPLWVALLILSFFL